MTPKSPASTVGDAANGVLKVKTFLLRNLFYWTGKVYVEAMGREITWARERLAVEEQLRARGQKLTRCEHCGSFKKEGKG